ncbi:hypothetical protein ABZ636_40760 [Streptomyces sp. NPDC007251]|uniref:DUF6895 family protein n=1 Tax=Streptomyces sp. NPDC007251 TaxID=3154483 RepID=UPI0033D3234B
MPQFDDLLPLSIAARPAHPIHMMAADIYALTHVPMFMTDFGRNPAPAGFPHERCRQSLDATASWVLYTDNFDLMGEIILARELLHAPWTTAHLLAWKTLEFAWGSLGFLTSPSFTIKQFKELPDEEKSQYAFRHIYHTAYVAGILCATLLGSPPATGPESYQILPTSEIEALRNECRKAFKDAMTFCIDDLDEFHTGIDHLTQLTKRVHDNSSPLQAVRRLISVWQSRDCKTAGTILQVVEQANLPESPVASALADGLLSSTARAYDLPMMAQTLRLVASLELPVTPTVAAAARFLIRQQLPNGAIGGWFLSPENADNRKAIEVTVGLASALGALSIHPMPR